MGTKTRNLFNYLDSIENPNWSSGVVLSNVAIFIRSHYYHPQSNYFYWIKISNNKCENFGKSFKSNALETITLNLTWECHF